eukprot:333713-Rhodomonas_salina.3
MASGTRVRVHAAPLRKGRSQQRRELSTPPRVRQRLREGTQESLHFPTAQLPPDLAPNPPAHALIGHRLSSGS